MTQSTEILDELDGIELTRDDELLLEGYIDSLGIIRLVAFMEEEFGMPVPPEDVTIENFRSVAVIAEYVLERSA